VVVAPVRGLELWAAGGFAREVNLFVSNRLTVLLNVANTGNAPDEAGVELSGDFASWGRFDASFVPVAPGEIKVLRLDLTVPDTAVTTSIYPLTVRATSLGRPDLSVERILFLTVKDFDPTELEPRLGVHPQHTSVTLIGDEELVLPVSVLCTGSDIGNVSLRITGAEELGVTYRVTELPRDLRAGENHTFLVVLRRGGGTASATDGTLTIEAVGEGVSAPVQTVSIKLEPAPRAGHVVSMEGLATALGVFLALGGLALGWNEVVLVAILNLLLPVYVKLRREEVLDQYTRGKIHGYIIANPGEHYNSIKAQLRLKNGTLAYHLRVLEREGYVKTTRDGMFKRFYPEAALLPRRRSEYSAIQEIVLENVRTSPGITQNELARRMGVSSQVVNYHIRNLVAAGAIRLDREGRLTRCYLN
jgi:predicted transcriptional regulator